MLDSYLDGISTIIITDNDLNRMKNRDGIIVDESLGIVAYKYSFSQHQQCCDDFGRSYIYEYTDERSLIRSNNICFRLVGPIDGKYIVTNFIPEKISDKMLAGYLEVINKMKDDKLDIFAIKKCGEHFEKDYQYIDNFNENIYCDIVCDYLSKKR